MNISRDRQDDRELNPYLALGTVAALGGIDRDCVFALILKGFFSPIRNKTGKTLIPRGQVLAWFKDGK
jgi:hypothetical protein